ncbi:MAG: class I SAM-dependent methyltransferase [Anaerolineae bacterium]
MTTDPTIEAYDCRLLDAPPDLDLPRERTRFCALLPRGGRVLDLGAGSGWAARRMAADGFRAVALERSAGRVARARGDGALAFVLGDMRTLPFEAAVFDGVWACASLLHLSRREMPAALGGIRRLLREGGTLYVSMKAGEGEGWQSRGHDAARFFAYYGGDELDALLAEAGFQRVDGWTSPASPWDPTHPWLSRFAVVTP